ncbi:hypothetical protein LUZ60_005730 [Juncus effusus]|nr:hypothetical protein LUZ60_005730 [Juncus effusus]
MASMMLSKRAFLKGLQCSFICRPLVSASTVLNQIDHRSLTTDSHDDAGTSTDERSVDVERRSDRKLAPRRGRRDDFFPAFFSDPWDPFNPGRTLSQMLNFMDQFLDTPFAGRGSFRTGWDAREDDNAFYLKVEMPGLSKEDVKVCVEGNTVVIKGEKEEEDRTSNTQAEGQNQGQEQKQGQMRRRYSSRIDIPDKGYKLDQIKAEMRHGVLSIIVPKTQEENGDVIEPRNNYNITVVTSVIFLADMLVITSQANLARIGPSGFLGGYFLIVIWPSPLTGEMTSSSSNASTDFKKVTLLSHRNKNNPTR